jgi:ABC-type lipoprotein export system ATPase subunit/GNAT superfamily N-acetyltransferase
LVRRKEFFNIQKFARRYDKQSGKFIINISYETATEISPRTIAVAEAFGLGVDQTQKFVIYDNVELKIGPTDIVYITGDSGSGKSILLKALKKDLLDANTHTHIHTSQVIDIADVQIDQDKPLIETVGKTVEEGLELLSRVGLNDAFLFLRKYKELSDGQKYRYRIAKMIESGAQWWVMDEFCATLDRDTAKIVAFNLQKLARKEGKAVLVATTHTDLFEDLHPSVHIHKRFGKEISLNYYPNIPAKECSLVREMRIEEGTKEDFKKLAEFHYRSHLIPMVRKIFRLVRGNELVGVIVYRYPPSMLFGRSQVFDGKVPYWALNQILSNIGRVVIHPKYRTIGLGAKLVKETLPLVGTAYVETSAVMARYNPFFEHGGMTKICEKKPEKKLLECLKKLRELGFILELMASRQNNLRILKNMKDSDVEKVRQALIDLDNTILGKNLLQIRPKPMFLKKSESIKLIHKASLEQLAGLIYTIVLMAQVKVYLFWSKFEKEKRDI